MRRHPKIDGLIRGGENFKPEGIGLLLKAFVPVRGDYNHGSFHFCRKQYLLR
jgi:hypothetical protein